MKVSPQRYKQSRQGATLTSSKWTMTVIVASIVCCAAIVLIMADLLRAGR